MRARLSLAVACAALLSAPAARGADPKAACLTAADQGQSLRDDGKYRRAHDAFVTCSSDDCPKVVARSCAQWLRQLDDATPTVVLGAKDDAGADVTTAHVTIDGQPLTDALDGKPQPIDPGEHTLRFARDGFDPAETHVVVRAGEKNRAVMVSLHGTAPKTETPEPAKPPEPQQASLFTTRNVTVVMLGVLGAAAVGGGVYFLSQSGSQSSTASGLRSGLPSDACTLNPSSSTCVQLKNAVDTQHSDSTIGASMLVGGGVLLVGAVVAWLAWPSSDEPAKTGVRVQPGLSPGLATLGMSGSF
jgi:hypothetical protein